MGRSESCGHARRDHPAAEVSRPGKPNFPKLPASAAPRGLIVLASCVPKHARRRRRPADEAPSAAAGEAADRRAARSLGRAGPSGADEAEAAPRSRGLPDQLPGARQARPTPAASPGRRTGRRPCGDRGAGRPAIRAAAFFAEQFRAGPGRRRQAAFVTGYFEPQIAGSRTRQPGYDVPVYRKPPDLVEVDAATAEAAGTPRRGRLENGVDRPLLRAGRDRGRRARRPRPRDRLGGRPDRLLLPPDPGLGPAAPSRRRASCGSAMPARTAANMSASAS